MVNLASLMLQSEIYDFLNELFLDTSIWGLIGPTILVIASVYLMKRDKFLGLIMIFLMSLFAFTYFENAPETATYYWHGLIMILGIMTCTFLMITKR